MYTTPRYAAVKDPIAPIILPPQPAFDTPFLHKPHLSVSLSPLLTIQTEYEDITAIDISNVVNYSIISPLH